MFLDGLDALDQKIVQLLIHNARMSYSDIGESVGISRVAVKARIQSLERRGIIEEYTTIINPQKISGAVSCYFEIETLPDALSNAIEALSQNHITGFRPGRAAWYSPGRTVHPEVTAPLTGKWPRTCLHD